MPYKKKKVKGGYKVCKKDDSKCFSKKPMSKEKADDQMKAMYANENKSVFKEFDALFNECLKFIEEGNPCWDGYEKVEGKKDYEKGSCRKKKKSKKKTVNEEIDKDRMECNKPRYLNKGESGHGKKQKVVKACKDGKEKIVKFGDANMENKSDNKKNRKNFRSRHNCSDKKDKFKAGYWACKDW